MLSSKDAICILYSMCPPDQQTSVQFFATPTSLDGVVDRGWAVFEGRQLSQHIRDVFLPDGQAGNGPAEKKIGGREGFFLCPPTGLGACTNTAGQVRLESWSKIAYRTFGSKVFSISSYVEQMEDTGARSQRAVIASRVVACSESVPRRVILTSMLTDNAWNCICRSVIARSQLWVCFHAHIPVMMNQSQNDSIEIILWDHSWKHDDDLFCKESSFRSFPTGGYPAQRLFYRSRLIILAKLLNKNVAPALGSSQCCTDTISKIPFSTFLKMLPSGFAGMSYFLKNCVILLRSTRSRDGSSDCRAVRSHVMHLYVQMRGIEVWFCAKYAAVSSHLQHQFLKRTKNRCRSLRIRSALSPQEL